MWRVKNKTPFSAEGYFERDRDGREVWCIAVRARFTIAPDGTTIIAEQQSPIKLAPEYVNNDPQELLSESDISPFRPNTDMLVHGQVCTPEYKPLNKQNIYIRAGNLEKKAVAIGSRRALISKNKIQLIDHQPIQNLPLSWRYAYGGKDLAQGNNSEHVMESNPIGTGYCSKPLTSLDNDTEFDLPCIEDIHHTMTSDSLNSSPVGFGPVAAYWSPRKEHAGTFDQTWQTSRAPLLPLDFSENFYQSAPIDQIYKGNLVGGEPVTIDGLHAQGQYHFHLPNIRLYAKTWLGRQMFNMRFKLITLELHATDKAIEMIWNSHLPCNGQDHLIRESIITFKKAVKSS